MPPIEIGQTLRLRGRARSLRSDAPWIIGRASLVALRRNEAWSAEPVFIREPFDLVMDDGAIVRVDPSELLPDAVVPEHRAEGAFAEISHLPMADGFRARTPGPHVRLAFCSATIAPDATVEVYGTVTEAGFHEASGGLRAVPEKTVTALRAALIAGGADPAAAFEAAYNARFPPARWAAASVSLRESRRVFAAMIALGVASAVAGVAGTVLGRSAKSNASCIYLAALLVAVGLQWRDAVRFFALSFEGVTRRRGLADTPGPAWASVNSAHATRAQHGVAIVSALVVGCVGMLAAMDALGSLAPEGTGRLTAIVAVSTALVLGVLPIERALATRRTARLARLLLTSPAHAPGLRDEAWGVSAGVVRTTAPFATALGPAAVALITENELTPGSDPNIQRVDLRAPACFVVDTENGLLEIDPADALWTSTAQHVTPPRRDADRKTHVERVELVPAGGRVLAAGWLRRTRPEPAAPARLSSTGPESLVFIATGPNGDPRAELRAMLRARARTVVALAALGLGVAGYTAYLWLDASMVTAPGPHGDNDNSDATRAPARRRRV